MYSEALRTPVTAAGPLRQLTNCLEKCTKRKGTWTKGKVPVQEVQLWSRQDLQALSTKSHHLCWHSRSWRMSTKVVASRHFCIGRSPYRHVRLRIRFSLDHVEVGAFKVDGSVGSVSLSSNNYKTHGEHKNGFSCTVRNTSCILLSKELLATGYGNPARRAEVDSLVANSYSFRHFEV